MKVQNINNTAFQGYKNIIHNDINQNNIQFTFMSMQLDDKCVKDLTELRQIQKLQGIDTNSDVLNIFYANKNKSNEFLYFNDRVMFLGEELRNMWEKFRREKAYQVEEKVSLKAYGLIANITGRMMQNELPAVDNDFPHVIKSTMKSFMKIFTATPEGIFSLVQESILENKPLGKTASILNEVANKNMRIFFK